MEKCDEECFVSATKRGSVPEREDGKPRKVGDINAGAEQCVVDERNAWEVSERKRLGYRRLSWNLLLSKNLLAT